MYSDPRIDRIITAKKEMTTLFSTSSCVSFCQAALLELHGSYQLQAFMAEKIGFMVIDVLQPGAPMKESGTDRRNERPGWVYVRKIDNSDATLMKASEDGSV